MQLTEFITTGFSLVIYIPLVLTGYIHTAIQMEARSTPAMGNKVNQWSSNSPSAQVSVHSPAHSPVHQSCPPVQSRVLRLLQPICVLIGTIWDHVITAMLAQYVLQPSFDIIAGTISFVAGYSQYIKVFHTRQKHRMVNRSRSMRLFPN